MSTTSDAEEGRRAWLKIKIIARLIYVAIAFIIALVMLLKHPAESFERVADKIVSFLENRDVFFITRLWWKHGPWSWDIVQAFLAADWLTLIIIAGGAIIMYAILYEMHTGGGTNKKELKEGRAWRVVYSIVLSGLTAILIQYTLILLVRILGGIAGLITWVAALIAAVEILIHLHDAVKSGWELKSVAKETGKELGKKTNR